MKSNSGLKKKTPLKKSGARRGRGVGKGMIGRGPFVEVRWSERGSGSEKRGCVSDTV